MDLDWIAVRQYHTIERNEGHKRTTLEALALLAAAVGAAVGECREEEVTPEFEGKLADVLLKTVDLAYWRGIDITSAVAMRLDADECRSRGWRI